MFLVQRYLQIIAFYRFMLYVNPVREIILYITLCILDSHSIVSHLLNGNLSSPKRLLGENSLYAKAYDKDNNDFIHRFIQLNWLRNNTLLGAY